MPTSEKIIAALARELTVAERQVLAAVQLLDDGATVPFIARYRKEVTGGLDDTQLRNLEERLTYLRELEERRGAILKSIADQDKLTPDLKSLIEAADTKTRLEDLYAPYKPKRRTKAQIAREAGLEPLLDRLLADPALDPQTAASDFITADAGFADADAVLDGARQIFMERAAEDAELVGRLRDHAWEQGQLVSTVVEGQEESGSKFKDYFEFREAIKGIPSHRALALFRGRTEGALRIKLEIPGQDDVEPGQPGQCETLIAAHFGIRDEGRAADRWLRTCAGWAWRVKLAGQLETELNLRLRESAEEEAIQVFGNNLRDLLLAAPAGSRATLGLDPGLRTGVKVVVVDGTGKLLEHSTIYPHAPKNQWDASIDTLAKLCARHHVDLVSIGNGTASRETDKLVRDLMQRHPELRLTSLMVSEAGASVYSASELAANEFPDLDVSLRGAVSIARRLQDPLAELVKIEPKSIGVGQYQHDVNQYKLARKLEAIVEDCVNAVGVEVNTASVPLLTQVAGLSDSLARNIVSHREQHGAFRNRQQLLEVPRLGPKAFEQAAGFLRIHNSENPLDASAVHPEAYPVMERILSETSSQLTDIIGNSRFLRELKAANFTDEQFGEPTVRDILQELEKPGRDPRPEFKTATFKEGVEKISDLKPGMILEGVVTNVTNFGAFVDVGVHQDGLVHISVLADKFVKDPREVVKTGDLVKVRVVEVDQTRKRISLSMRLTEEAGREKTEPRRKPNPTNNKGKPRNKTGQQQPGNTAMADAFAKLRQR